MPSTTSSSVAMTWLSSTVITPSLPTLSIASAMREPICSSWLEIAATWATSSWPLTGTESFLISSTTASTAFWMPFLRACLASTSNVTVFAIYLSLLPYLLLGLVGLAVGCDDGEHVLLGHDQVLDVVDLEFVPGVLGVKHFVADFELHRHLGAVVQESSGPHGLDDGLLWLLLGC